MILARVKGNTVATTKLPCYQGQRVLVVQPIDEKGVEQGDWFLACDATSAGPGEIVLVQRQGTSARQLLGSDTDPFHSVICGIVDQVFIGNSQTIG